MGLMARAGKSLVFPMDGRIVSRFRDGRCAVCLFAFFFIMLAEALARPKVFPARGFAKVLTKEEAAERLERFRRFHAINPGEEAFHHGFLLRFRLEHYPRRGEVFTREGTLCGLAFGHGLLRLDIAGVGEERGKTYLLRNGPEPEAWRALDGNGSEKLAYADFIKPLVPGMGQTIFDLMMPFIFWEEWRYEKSGRVIGRPSHLYEFSPPNEVRKLVPSLRKVRLTLDDVYEAPLRVEIFGSRGVPDKTFVLVSLKKVGETWIAKTLDVRDARTRSRTRLAVTAAATDLDLGKRLFTPAGLTEVPRVPEEILLSFE